MIHLCISAAPMVVHLTWQHRHNLTAPAVLPAYKTRKFLPCFQSYLLLNECEMLCMDVNMLAFSSVSACRLWPAHALCARPSASSRCHVPCAASKSWPLVFAWLKLGDCLNAGSCVLEQQQADAAGHRRERAAGYYSSYPFSLANLLIEIPYLLVQTILYSCIT